MATEKQGIAAGATGAVAESNLLEDAIAATKQTPRDEAQDLLKTLTEEALKGTVRFDKNLTVTFNRAIKLIDAQLSTQLAAVMHHPDFLKLEGSWRGLHHLVKNSHTGDQLKIKVLNVSKKELAADLAKAVEFDQSTLFKQIYENEFGIAGGEPYGALIGDFELGKHPDDLEFLTNMSHVAAGAFAPFITSANSSMFGLSDFRELSKPRDLESVFGSAEYARWRSFRESEDSRFVALTMPRVLARVPYGAATKAIDEFAYEEAPFDAKGAPKSLQHEEYCWMNASYVMATRLTDAFEKYGWCTAIRGAEGGGRVDSLPTHLFISDDGDMDLKCPTEIGISDRREGELSKLGFLPLCHYKNTDYAVFFGGQTTQKPLKYDRPDAQANAAISARLPYILATSRIAHFLKVMGRDKIASAMEAEDCERWLNRWISNYVNSNPRADAEMKARFPLREAKVEVTAVPGRPGSYNAVAYLRPWLQMEELTASLRMVASIPEKA
ncbi:MAG TPA: type VI secretion system contractile sheath large subunit [Steroidobacteraceae bacterium]|jgi:type VI secretion system protein ImpC